MSDIRLTSIVIVDVDATEGEVAYLTNAGFVFTYEGKVYTSCPAMKIDEAALTGDFSTTEYKIEKLLSSVGVLARLSTNTPYPKVTVNVREVFLDDDYQPVSVRWLFRGLLNQVQTRPWQGYIDLICKDFKYYLDTTAGVICAEHCSAPYFGDLYVCKKTVISASYTIASISGFNITLSADPALTTPFIYNAGIMRVGGSAIKIQYHETGRVFQMSRPVPPYWAGATVELSTGCDKRLETCRNIHNNESRFWGLGHSMVDYNPYYENP